MGRGRRNEVRKFAAAVLSGCAVAVLSAGAVVPLAQVAGARFGWPALGGAMVASLVLAALAGQIVRGFEDDET